MAEPKRHKDVPEGACFRRLYPSQAHPPKPEDQKKPGISPARSFGNEVPVSGPHLLEALFHNREPF
uniref:hypothetical protein n=1 Tax=Marinobacter sp. TaxID=50741 RepID=UPI0035C6F220